MIDEPMTPDQVVVSLAEHYIAIVESMATRNITPMMGARAALTAAIKLGANADMDDAAIVQWLREAADHTEIMIGLAKPAASFAPTKRQEAAAEIAQHEVEEVLRKLLVEGLDFPAVMAGAATAFAQIVATGSGPASVGKWFADMADQTRNYGRTVN